MKSVRQIISISISVMLLFTAVACSTGNNTEEKVKPEDTNQANTNTPEKSDAPQVAAKVSMMISDHSRSVPSGNVMEDPTIKYLAEKTNTDLTIEFMPHSEYYTQMKVKFASGSLPDIIQDWRVNPDLFLNDKLLPLNDLLDEFGPTLKSTISKEAWDTVTINGKIYGIPETAQGNAASSRVIYVRKDWMDKVGIKENPKTPDEFLDMLRAFRDKDPNGNKLKDEIPFTSRANLNWSENLMGMFGVTPSGNHLLNGEIVPDIIHPQMKKALAFFRTMVEEKLIDSEFLTLQRNVWEQKIQSDLAGSWNHVTDLSWDWQDRLNKSLPGIGADVIAIPTPRAPGVENVGMEVNAVKKVFNITNSAKNPEAIIRLFDWMASQEGQEFVNFGVPDVTYTKVGDEIFYNKQKDIDNKTNSWRIALFNLIGYNKELLTVQLGQDAVNKLDATYAIAREEGIPNPVVGMPAVEAEQKYPDISRYGSMFIQDAAKIMLGKEPVDYFDKFVENWRAQGGNEIVKEMTDWYNANRK